MHRTIEARIEANGAITLLEPIQLQGSHRALVTVLNLVSRPKVKSKYAGAFSSGQTDISERVDEILADCYA